MWINIFQQSFRIAEFFVAKVIKREFYDMLFINAFFGQIITKKFEKKKRFSTSLNTCNNFYKIISFSWNQHIKVFFSLDYHILLRKFVFTTYFRSKTAYFLGLLKCISLFIRTYLPSIITISSFVRLHIQDNELCRKYIFRSLFLREISYNVFYLSYHLLNQPFKFFIIRIFMGI